MTDQDKQIIELLGKIQRPVKDELVPAWWVEKYILTFVDQALALLRKPTCERCGGHKGWISCPKCGAQICWLDIDPKREGFIRCRRCHTPDTEFIKVPCPKCQPKEKVNE